ncbi:L,D-transpeptidase family protein [Salinisphaera hydrothermalis]|uniref:L,D-transpeptidase family protein n=1 Tax=Salinisphaera hydrothermalis TaxID=563188 RepID=UPI00333FEC72
MRARRYLATLGIGLLLCATLGPAWGDTGPDPAVAQQLQTMLAQTQWSNAPADASLDQVRRFYQTRDFRPVWNRPDAVPAFVAALYTLVDDGLEPSDYGAGRIEAAYRRAYAPDGNSATRAAFDLVATRLYLSVLDDLNRGKVDPALLAPVWGLPVERYHPDMAALSRSVDTLDFEHAFAMARPTHPTYQRLRAALARYRDIQNRGGWPVLPAAAGTLRPGDINPAVPLLRQRLAAVDDIPTPSAAPDVYDDALAAAVRRFQRAHYLNADAVVGAQTRAALNVGVAARIDQIRVNLERARLLMHNLPRSFVLVDIAGYRLTYYRPDGQVWRTRIVVGLPYRRTPSLRSEITHLTFNPTWTVPASITYREMLPRIRRSPGYLAREHLRVLSPSGHVLNPAAIDWSQPPPIVLRQSAGPDNALGRVVFRFPNPYTVYLHDTPSQSLFDQPRRAFSHGCMRVQHALEFARLLLDDAQHWNAADIDRVVASGKTTRVNLVHPVPVIVHYWTVNVGADGRLAFKPDIYARDQALLAALDQPLDLVRNLH